jgi:alpha-glucosidase
MSLPLSAATSSKNKDDAIPVEKPGKPWWQGAVIYQIYPRSFLDTNGDGIGDLRGCIEGLEYIASLGVDGIWVSPFFTSPMNDFGYDVADYCNVDPVFGTLEDFDELVEKAHRLNLKIIIDQVYSHTSDAHDWFQTSRQDSTNEKADWYVWADPKDDGSPPNNWQSVFGGPAWTWENRRKQYYLHNFLSSQPDLNVRNKDVQDALLRVAKFWLDRGVDGFRLDAINFAMHDPDLRDNPPAPRDGRDITRPFDLQQHLYNQSHPDVLPFLERVRAVVQAYEGRFTVAEIGGPDPLAEMKAFTKDSKRLDSAYSFDFLYADKLTPGKLKAALNNWTGKPGEGWPSWAFSNHDAPRAISRWHDGSDPEHFAKMTSALLLSIRGNPILYQGEELGMPQTPIPFEKLQDPEAIANWPQTLGRDGARTPLPWDAEQVFAGFSKSEPWLPIGDNQSALAINRQESSPKSTLNFVRHILQIRSKSNALKFGDLVVLPCPYPLFAFVRTYEGEAVLCVFNLGGDVVAWTPEGLPKGLRTDRLLLQNRSGHEKMDCVYPYGAYFATLKSA